MPGKGEAGHIVHTGEQKIINIFVRDLSLSLSLKKKKTEA